jgi:hypothetical protein
MRPMPFEPAHEFDGIHVQVESPEIFHVNLPDGRSAFVAPGETTPSHTTINKIEVDGKRLRYIQMTKDVDDVCGLGVNHITGVASFSEPAAFRLQRTSEDVVRVTTNTGISLTDQWLRGQAHRIEALTLEHQWVNVTSLCQNSSIPQQVVDEWSGRNQRTLVDFKVSI